MAGLLALVFLPLRTQGQDLYTLAGNTINRITPEGAVSTFASYDVDTTTRGLAFNSTGTLFVSLSSGRIDEISRGGVVSTFATGLGVLNGGSLAFNSNGTLYATNLTTVSAITPGGVVSTLASGFNQLTGVVCIDDTVYVSDYGNAMVYGISSGGAVSPAVPVGQMGTHPTLLVTDGFQRLWTASPDDESEFDNLYSFPLEGSPYTAMTGLNTVSAIAFNGAESMYYAQAGIISLVNPYDEVWSPSIFATVGGSAMAFSTVPEPSAAPAVMGLVALAGAYWRARRKRA